jgi:tetratricopeptide (TPR) repeat protein/transcriptional regulator with XRE-family HTH domain
MTPSQNRIAYYRDRCRPPLTQAGLARALGVHVNAIYRWERNGVPTPAKLLALTQLLVEQGAITSYEAARAFWSTGGSETFPEPYELSAFFQANAARAPGLPGRMSAPTYLPSGSWLPLRANPHFEGRDKALRLLAEQFAVPSTVAITGMGGIGKTQLAVEFAHRFGARFPGGVFWLSFANPDAVPSAVAGCGELGRMGLRPDFSALPLGTQVRLVQAAWQEPVDRLLIFDNCEDEALLEAWRPVTGGCRVLITSRRVRWPSALDVHPLPLEVLRRKESIALLRRHRPDLDADDQPLDSIADTLGDLPLTLHLAGSYLARYRAGVTPATYLANLRQAGDLSHPSLRCGELSPTHHVQDINHTFALSYDQLVPGDTTDALALQLLALVAHLAPGEPVPRSLLHVALSIADDSVAILMFEDAIRRVVDLGLLSEENNDTVRMHRLLVTFVRTQGTAVAAQEHIEAALIAEAQRLSDTRMRAELVALQVHLRSVTERALQQQSARAPELCEWLGWHLTLLIAWDEARTYLELSLTLRQRKLADAHAEVAASLHADVAASLHALALHLQQRGDFVAACTRHAQAVAIWEQSLGEQHLDTARGYMQLGYALGLRGSCTDGLAYLRKALRTRRRALGLRNAMTAHTLSHLGFLLYKCGRPRRGQRYLRLALAIREQVLPPESPMIAQTLNNLGEACFATGDYTTARGLHERAQGIRQAVLGEEHPHTAETLKNLGVTLRALGASRDGRALLVRAVQILTATSGPHNLDTAWACDCLAELLIAEGETAAAQPFLAQALVYYEAQLLLEHHDTARTRARLAGHTGS